MFMLLTEREVRQEDTARSSSLFAFLDQAVGEVHKQPRKERAITIWQKQKQFAVTSRISSLTGISKFKAVSQNRIF